MNVQKVFYTFLFFFNFCLFCSLYAYKEVVVQDRKKEIEYRARDENIKIFEKQRNMNGTVSKDYLSGGIVNNTGNVKKQKESKIPTDLKNTPKIVAKDYPIIIGCINEITGEIRKPLNQEYSACYHGTKGWKNLRFPSKKQLEIMKDVYKNRDGIITAMTLINHESQFNSNAKGCHKYGCDYGILQIRDVNGGKNMTDRQQMEWFLNRKAWQLSEKGNCYRRVQEGNHENILRCVFSRHHGDLVGTALYPTKRYEEWKFYNQINF